MGNKGRSEPDIFGGGYTNYDEKGHKIGRSEPDIFGGGFTNYDNKGNKIGRSEPKFFGGYNHYDENGNKTGHSDPGFFGSYNHYDSSGKKTGSSNPGLSGGYSHNNSEGCYIATCVYGSYDCPEVWVLRRFRDNVLATTVPGRLFIKVYYALSPKLVKWFGQKKWFRTPWKRWLDKRVEKLKEQGFEDAEYEDREE